MSPVTLGGCHAGPKDGRKDAGMCVHTGMPGYRGVESLGTEGRGDVFWSADKMSRIRRG